MSAGEQQPEGAAGAERAAGHVLRLGGDPPSPFELALSFSRTVVAGEWVLIGGTTSVDPNGVVLGETPYEQTVVVLRKLVHELDRVGAGVEDVVQARAYLTDISRAEEAGRAWSEVFGAVRPLLTAVQVAALIDPRMLVEIELVAYRSR